jgi:hypothetical protein
VRWLENETVLIGSQARDLREKTAILAAYDTLAQQRDAAVRERESALELAAADERRLCARIEEVRTLRARLAACVSACEFAIEELKCDGHIRTKDEPEYGHWCATCDSHVDVNGAVRELLRTATLATTDDFGPNDGHARTVRRTPPQDAATTRGEG